MTGLGAVTGLAGMSLFHWPVVGGPHVMVHAIPDKLFLHAVESLSALRSVSDFGSISDFDFIRVSVSALGSTLVSVRVP